MGTLTASLLLPARPITPEKKASQFVFRKRSKKNRLVVPVARLFGPSIFEASKLNVLFLGVDEEKHPEKLPRTYTLTHCDITSKITLAISRTINSSQLQGWYNRLQRDEVVAEWKKVKGKMSLHVHCHISGGHFLLNLCARLRFYIFCKELPVVLKAFVHGDGSLLTNYPELQDSLVWVYFHTIIQEFNRVECWGPLKEAASSPPLPSIAADGGAGGTHTKKRSVLSNWEVPQPCQDACSCCFPSMSSIHGTVLSSTARGPRGHAGPIVGND